MGKYTLVGVGGNALAIMEYVIRAMRRESLGLYTFISRIF